MWLDRVSNSGPVAFESDGLLAVLRGLGIQMEWQTVQAQIRLLLGAV